VTGNDDGINLNDELIFSNAVNKFKQIVIKMADIKNTKSDGKNAW
jgi:hypothetical protein